MKYLVSVLLFIFCFTLHAQVDKEAAIAYNEGVIAFKEKNYEGAIVSYNKALMHDPTYNKARYNRAKARLRVADYGKAIGDFNELLKNDPQNVNAHVYKAYAFMQLKKYPGAISSYNKALELDPSLIDTYANRGIAFMHEKKYKEAIADFQKVIAEESDNNPVKYNLAICQTKAKDTDAAIVSYSGLIESGYKPEVAYKERGKLYVSKKQYDKAIPDLDQALASDEDYNLYYLRGSCKLKTEDLEGASADFSKAITMKPDHKPSLQNKAYVSFKLKDYDQAVVDFSNLLSIDPDDIISRTNRGLAYQQLEQHQKAFEDFNSIIERRPEESPAYFNRANAAIGLGQYKEGCNDMRQAAKLGYEKAFDHIAWVCAKVE